MRIFCLTLLVLLTAGCSHNAIQYGDGIGLETTLRPDTGNFGITFRYGKILSAAVRENSEVEMTGNGSGGNAAEDAATAAASSSVKIKIGRQITGYCVDALEAGAAAKELEEYIAGK